MKRQTFIWRLVTHIWGGGETGILLMPSPCGWQLSAATVTLAVDTSMSSLSGVGIINWGQCSPVATAIITPWDHSLCEAWSVVSTWVSSKSGFLRSFKDYVSYDITFNKLTRVDFCCL